MKKETGITSSPGSLLLLRRVARLYKCLLRGYRHGSSRLPRKRLRLQLVSLYSIKTTTSS